MSKFNMFNVTSLVGKQDGPRLLQLRIDQSFSFTDFEEEMLSEGSSTRYAKQPLDLPASCAAAVQFAVRQLRIDPPLFSQSQQLQIRSVARLR